MSSAPAAVQAGRRGGASRPPAMVIARRVVNRLTLPVLLLLPALVIIAGFGVVNVADPQLRVEFSFASRTMTSNICRPPGQPLAG